MATIGHNNLNAKLVLLGDMGAGKSSLVLRFVKGQFLEFQESTIGAAFFSQTLAVNDATVKFEIWDTAGQERYHSLAPMYYRGAAAAIIVYDVTSTESFARAKKWVQELQKQGNPNMVMALAGNKSDLEERRSVPAEEARKYAEENGLFFMETSAKTAQNVNEIFYEIVARSLWCRLFGIKDEAWVAPGSLLSFLAIKKRGFGCGKDLKVLWNCAIFAILWVLWNERNDRIFKEKRKDNLFMWDKVVFLASLWSKAAGFFPDISLTDIQRNDWSFVI